MSYVSSYFHCVFSTKGRRPVMTPVMRERLWPYLGGIARENGLTAISIGGVADHVHLLLVLPATMAVAKAMQLIKGGSSKWVHDTFPDQHGFQWQEKYGAFSVSVSQVDRIIRYIENQEEHHRKVGFRRNSGRCSRSIGLDTTSAISGDKSAVPSGLGTLRIQARQ